MEKKIFLNKNIVLIGMPGSGKTTIGTSLSEIINIPFIDVDEYIEKKHNTSIDEIFKGGEDSFRRLESEAIKEISKEFPRIISTGGGAVKVHENMKVLEKNSIIFFIDRPVELIYSDIDIFSRPLLKNNPEALYSLYKERISLYKRYSDYEIDNSGKLSEAVKRIIYILEKIG